MTTKTEEGPPRRRSWRRHIASLLLLVGAILLGNYLCVARGRLVAVEIRYRLGDPPAAQSMSVDARPRGRSDVVARFRREGLAAETIQKTRLEPGLYDLEITLVAAGGRQRVVLRPIEAREGGGVVTVDLSGEAP